MACSSCRQVRRDLAAALRRGNVLAAAKTAAKGVTAAANQITIKAPPLLRRPVKRIR